MDWNNKQRIVGSKSIEFVETQHTKYRDATRASKWKRSMYWFRGRIPKVLSRRKERDTSRSKKLRRGRNSVYFAKYNWWCVFLQRQWYSSYFFLVACWIHTTKDPYRNKVEHLSKNGNKRLSILLGG